MSNRRPARRYDKLKAEVQRRSARESPHAIAKDLDIHRSTAYAWAFYRPDSTPLAYALSVQREARELMVEGLNNGQIEEQIGVSRSILKLWRRRWNLKGTQKRENLHPRAHSEEMVRSILDRVAAGEEMAALAADNGLHPDTVSRWWRASGRTRETSRKDAILARALAGESPQKIAQDTGVSRGTIYRWMREQRDQEPAPVTIPIEEPATAALPWWIRLWVWLLEVLVRDHSPSDRGSADGQD